MTSWIALAVNSFLAVYGASRLANWLFFWFWERTHPNFRRFTFETHTGLYWRLNGSRNWLAASELTDALQDLHDETRGKRPPELSREEP